MLRKQYSLKTLQFVFHRGINVFTVTSEEIGSEIKCTIPLKRVRWDAHLSSLHYEPISG